MDTRCAKINSRAKKAENAQAEMKGGRGVCSLVDSRNTPKTEEVSLAGKVNKIIVESYMKRPSLKEDAIKTLYRFVNNGVLVSQSPMYPCSASVSTILLLKNKYAFATAGDNVIFHFVNGILNEVFECNTDSSAVCVGTQNFMEPTISELHTFSQGENTFLMCTKNFADVLDEDILEETLAKATHTKIIHNQEVNEIKCDRWLKMLSEYAHDISKEESYSAIALTVPEKRKKPKWVAVLIAVILALIIGFFGFGALGKMRGGPNGGPNGSANGENERPGFSLFPPRDGDNQQTPPTRPARDQGSNSFFG